ncbi:hypothetical protein PCANC_10571 [Puccinia coronata f. sp. avenae]|uniref:Uncharacterized protein n=1 Tax=Puccinia coronata f. sp. avenae TaxID=200324 RepID=A0A2N5VR81_9BASI|nr:hypothetical protein PCANC_10571 [Puccinia coronata f. sp. avenae]
MRTTPAQSTELLVGVQLLPWGSWPFWTSPPAPLKKPHPVGLSDTASDTIVRCYVKQACPTWDQTILSDAMSNKPGSMGLSDMGSVNCVRSCVEQQCLMSLSDMGSNRLFDPMSDNICPMSFYSSDRLFDSFESVAEQASDEFSWRAGHWPALRAQFASRSLACLRTQFAEQASDLHRELSSPSRPVTCSRTELAEQVIGLLANSVRRAGQ